MIGEFMFGFGAGGDFPEMKEPERKREEREGMDYARFQKFVEKAKVQKVTITRDEFMHKCADASMFGKFASVLAEKDPEMRLRYPLLLAPFIADLAKVIYGEIEED